MRQKDLALLSAVLLFALYSFFSPSLTYVQITPLFHVALSTGHSQSVFNTPTSVPHSTFFPIQKIPPPIIDDLDADGQLEIILVDEDFTVKRVSYDNKNNNLRFEKQASLLGRAKVTMGRRPLKLQVGQIDPKSKNKIIIVILESWVVLCFDHSLNLIWESSFQDYILPDLFLEQLAVTVSKVPIYKGDVGSVYVSGAFKYQRQDEDHGHFEKEEGEELAKDEDAIARFQHVTLIAYDGATGTVRWRHSSDDDPETTAPKEHRRELHFGAKPPQGASVSSDQLHSYKLNVFKTVHLDEMDWRTFERDIVAEFPHHWQSRKDNRLALRYFSRQIGEGSRRDAKTQDARDLGLNTLGLQNNAGEKSEGKKVDPLQDILGLQLPNVLVAHLADGIQVVHLYTGKPVCHLQLSAREAVYDDVNADGVVEEIFLSSEVRASGNTVHRMFIKTLPPPSQLLANTTVASQNLNKKKKPSKVDFLAPFIYQKDTEEKGIVLLDSMGQLYFFNSAGKSQWQISTTSVWGRRLKNNREFYEPSLSAYTSHTSSEKLVQTQGKISGILAVGDEMSLVTPAGFVLATAELPAVPVGEPIIGDFNNDGVNDILVQSLDGLVGFQVTTSLGTPLFALFALFLLCFLLALSCIFNPPTKVVRQNQKRD